MHVHSALLLVALPLAALALPGAPSQIRDPNAFKSGIDVTGVTVTVRDADGKLVTGLTRDDFEVFEDGDPQAITRSRASVPVSVGVLLT
jgi:hypothetical protein